jgi:hypothetical protein
MPNRPPIDDDDAELELEPVDPGILEMERQRGQRHTDEAVAKIDLDELHQDRDQDGYDVDWGKLRQFRFSTRHLLIVTAVLAIAMSLHRSLGLGLTLFIMLVGGVAAGWMAVFRRDRQRDAERQRRREEFLANRDAGAAAALASSDDSEAPRQQEFKFAFSLKQAFITMTAAAVMLGILRLIGLETLTLTLGVLAAAGLLVLMVGKLEAAPALVFGWWVLLVLYLLFGLVQAAFANQSAWRQPPGAQPGLTKVVAGC